MVDGRFLDLLSEDSEEGSCASMDFLGRICRHGVFEKCAIDVARPSVFQFEDWESWTRLDDRKGQDTFGGVVIF
jgi:hypothetical protein